VSTSKSSAIDEAESVEPCSPKTSPGWTSNVSESTAETCRTGARHANTWVQTRLAPAAAVVSEAFERQPADGRAPVRRGTLPMGHLTKGHVV
jgi:hypothetical protein